VQPDDYRTPEEVDYARVIHSASFRRLQGKTQIINIADGDFARTRLTHSLEVSQVATGILSHLRNSDKREEVQSILPSRVLMETICMVHDLGHPPFGHGGEVALNFCMREHGGFEGNGQTIRILSKLEIFAPGYGSNLTRRTLLGTLKYPKSFSSAMQEKEKAVVPGVTSPINGQILLDRNLHEPPKCYMDTEEDVISWLLEPLSPYDVVAIYKQGAKSLDCSIMDLADDIAYGVHDLEDAISLGLVTVQQMTQDIPPALWDEFLERLASRYGNEAEDRLGCRYENFTAGLFSGNPEVTKRHIGRLVGYMIGNCYMQTRDEFRADLYRFKAGMKPDAYRLLQALKKFIYRRVIASPQLQQIRFKGQQMMIKLFALLAHDPEHLLPTDVYAVYDRFIGDDTAQMRVICDYIASMTDASLIRAYERLHSPRAGSTFDHL
jgi:dGTPase